MAPVTALRTRRRERMATRDRQTSKTIFACLLVSVRILADRSDRRQAVTVAARSDYNRANTIINSRCDWTCFTIMMEGRMATPVKVGLVGCGTISKIYLENAQKLDAVEIVACADLI